MTKAILVSKQMVDPDYIDYLTQGEEPQTIQELDFLRQMKTDPEQLMIYLARVSSKDQRNPNYVKLLEYCWKKKHFSVFEQVNVTLEVETDMCTAFQLIRHKSLFFQMRSRRYSSENIEFTKIEARRQDDKNRQNTIDDLDPSDKTWFTVQKEMLEMKALAAYEEGLKRGLGKEILRYLLPQSLNTKLYVTGNLRNFIHYINVRTEKSSQLEHRKLAEAMKKQLVIHFPNTSKAIGWKE